MGRANKNRALALWMNGELVGHWRMPATGRQEFLYAESWLESAARRPISLSLPLRPSREPYRDNVEAFFDNLLPDNRQIRERIQRRFQTASIAAFDLLQEIAAFVEERMLELLKARHGVFDLVTGVRCSLTE